MQSLTVEYQRFGGVTAILAPETRYLRTVGSGGPAQEVSFSIPQRKLLEAMGALDYGRFRLGDPDKVREVAEQVIDALEPRLADFLPRERPAEEGKPFQVEIVTRAFELAQLPFEILQQSDDNMIITRRIRLPWSRPEVVYDSNPRVLFAWAAPKREGGSHEMEVPHERHLELLEEQLRDWGGSETDALDVLPHATKKKLRQKLGREDGFTYTHIHLLAHGTGPSRSAADVITFVDLEAEPEPTTFLALEGEDGGIDRCSPQELAAMFPEKAPRPASFAVATCQSGEINSIESGGTIAHAIHEAGVPVVLASQLALTQTGSDQLISTFLATVLDGDDPREGLRLCRKAMSDSRDETYYDRVALVGYIHLEAGFEDRLPQQKFEVALARLKAASRFADKRVRQLLERGESGEIDSAGDLGDIEERFSSVRERLEGMDRRGLTKAQLEELHGLQASSLKREAEAAWKLSGALSGEAADTWRQRSREVLVEAAAAYGRAAKTSRDHHWTWVQWLALEAAINGDLSRREEDWIVARAAARDAAEREPADYMDDEVKRGIEVDAVWARGSLMELYLLAPLVGRGERAEMLEQAKDSLRRLVEGSQALKKKSPIESTRRQLARYGSWWGADDHWKLPAEIVRDAKQLHGHLTALSEGTPTGAEAEAPPRPAGAVEAAAAAAAEEPRVAAAAAAGDPGASGGQEAAPAADVRRARVETPRRSAGGSVFTIEMLPADEGDGLWIEYGPGGGRVNRFLIDCGRKTAYREVARRLGDDPDLNLELFVLTHVDADHIAGAVPLLQDGRFGPERVGDVWFNGWRHLNGWHKDEEPPAEGPDILGAKQGEFFGAVLRSRAFAWNDAFGGRAAVIEDEGDLPVIELPGGMKLTLLAPDWSKLKDMRDRWQRDLAAERREDKRIEPGDWETALRLLGTHRGAGPDVLRHAPQGPIIVEELAEQPFQADHSEPNGSSIAFLAEYGGKAALLAGDAHSPQLAASVRRLLAARNLDKLRVDCHKMSHHASSKNNSYELLELLDCKRYLVSTNGARHNHPDRETMARVLTTATEGSELVFNYRSEFSEPWGAERLTRQYGYTATYPEGDEPGIVVEL